MSSSLGLLRLAVVSVVVSSWPITAAAQATGPGTAKGTVTVNGTPTMLSYAIRVTKPNVFDETALDSIIIVSSRPLSTADAGNDAALLSRAQRNELVTVAIRFDERRGRRRLFNVAFNHAGLAETALLPDVWFEHTFKAGAGTLLMKPREFSGRIYAADLAFEVVVPVETTVAIAPPSGVTLPPASRTDADRAAATALLIQALQEGDEQRAMAIVQLGVDPNGRDQKMGIPVINWAVLMCQPPVVEALVALKADLKHERLPGMTLLSEAMAACPDAVPFLRAGGAQ